MIRWRISESGHVSGFNTSRLKDPRIFSPMHFRFFGKSIILEGLLENIFVVIGAILNAYSFTRFQVRTKVTLLLPLLRMLYDIQNSPSPGFKANCIHSIIVLKSKVVSCTNLINLLSKERNTFRKKTFAIGRVWKRKRQWLILIQSLL